MISDNKMLRPWWKSTIVYRDTSMVTKWSKHFDHGSFYLHHGTKICTMVYHTSNLYHGITWYHDGPTFWIYPITWITYNILLPCTEVFFFFSGYSVQEEIFKLRIGHFYVTSLLHDVICDTKCSIILSFFPWPSFIQQLLHCTGKKTGNKIFMELHKCLTMH